MTPVRQKAALVLAVAVAVVAVVSLAILGRDHGVDPTVSPPPEPGVKTESAQALGAAVPSTRGEPDATPSTRTREDLLREFWGEEFEGIQAQALREGVDLNGPATDCLPWEEVEGRILEMFHSNSPDISSRIPPSDEWPSPVDHGYLQVQFGEVARSLTDSELRAVDSIAAPYTGEIGRLASQRDQAILGAMVSDFQSGKYRKSPYFMPDSSPEHGLVLRRVIFTDGWCVDLCLRDQDWPAIAEMNSHIESQKKLRFDAVAEYLAQFQ